MAVEKQALHIAPLKYLLLAQNITCVFRNYWRFKKCGRTLICILVFLEVVVAIFTIVSSIQFENILVLAGQILYYFCYTLFSFALAILPIYHSKQFQLLLHNFDAFYRLFDDGIYSQILLRAQKSLIRIVIVFYIVKFVILTYLKASRHANNKNVRIDIMNNYNLSICEFQFILEYFILHAILFVISEQMKVIIRSIDTELSNKSRNRKKLESVESVTSSEDSLQKFEMWITAYKNIHSSSNLCNIMYSTELVEMLVVIVIYCILLLYTIAATITSHEPLSLLLTNFVTMVYFIIALYVISRAGQRVCNDALKLRCKLGEFYVYSVENERHFKMTKDLLRCCLTHPVRIHLLGSVNINMSLLPTCIAIVTSNTIIALQLNNVL